MLTSSPREAYRERRNTFFGKGLAAVLLVAVLALSCFVLLNTSDESSAVTPASGSYASGVEWSLDANGNLLISGTGAMDSYNGSPTGGPPWKSDVVTATIEDGVTNIGDYAFYGCGNLRSITIGKDVTNIPSWGIGNCISLESITVSPNNQTFKSVDGVLFSINGVVLLDFPAKSPITEYSIPDGVTTIDLGAFSRNSILTAVTCPDSVTNISAQAFAHCTSIQSVILSVGLTTINAYLFENCGSLRNVVMPGVTTIGQSAFKQCTGLENIYFGSGLTTVNSNAFPDTTFYADDGTTTIAPTADNLKGSMFVKSDNKLVKADDRSCGTSALWMFDDSTGTLMILGSGAMDDYDVNPKPWESFKSDIKSVVIFDGITSVGKSAFSQCLNLTTVSFPESLTSIGTYAFERTGLTSLILPSQITVIQNASFKQCESLTTLIVPSGVTEIETFAFNSCTSLSRVYLPDSIETLGQSSFYNCTSLEFIYFGSSLSIVPPNLLSQTLYDAEGLEIQKTADNLAGKAFSLCGDKMLQNTTGKCGTNAKYALDPNGMLTIFGTGWMDSYDPQTDPVPWTVADVKSVVIADGIESIGYFAFAGCTNMTSISIGKDVSFIGRAAFNGCSKLADITISPSNINYAVSDGVLYSSDTKTLVLYPMGSTAKSFSIPAGVTVVTGFAFSSSSNLESVTAPASLQSVGEFAFFECKKLQSVALPDTLITIGTSAFSGCVNLTSLTIPSGLTSLGAAAFRATAIEEAVIPAGITALPANVFVDCQSLRTVTLGKNVASVNDAFGNNHSLTRFIVDSENAKFVGDNGVLVDRSVGDLLIYPANKEGTVYSVPVGITKIHDKAFMGAEKLKTIFLPSTVNTIGANAFTDTIIESVTVPASVTTLGVGVFSKCTSLKNAEIGSGVTSIPADLFRSCTDLETVTIKGNVTAIGNGAFYACTALKQLTIPATVTTIGTTSFYGCIVLEEAAMPDGVTTIGANAFGGCTALAHIHVSNGLTSISSDSFSENTLYGEDGTTVLEINVSNLKGKDLIRVNGKLKIPSEGIVTDGSTNSKESVTDTADLAAGEIADLKTKAAADPETVLTFYLKGVTTATFDANAIGVFVDAATELSVVAVDKSTLTDEEKALVGDNPVFDIDFGANTDFGDGKATFTVPFTLPDGKSASNMRVYHIADGKIQETKNCTYADGKVTFDTNHLSMYMIGFESPSGSSGEFPILIVAVIAVVAVAGVGAFFFISKKKQA